MKTAFVFLTRNSEYRKCISDFINSEYNHSENRIYVVSNDDIGAEQLSISDGYKNSTQTNNSHINKECTALDMALHKFCYTDHDYVFLIEDDVFIPSFKALLELNKKCGNNDLCVPAHKYKANKIMDWHWPSILGKIERPWYYSMTCAVRLSRKMLNAVKQYVEENKTLFFHEVMFNTLAVKNELTVYCPPELKTILWQADWTLDNYLYLPNNFFHPNKYFDQHKIIREVIEVSKNKGYSPIAGRLPMFINPQAINSTHE